VVNAAYPHADNRFIPIWSHNSAVPLERKVLQKERASGSYHLSAYLLAKTVSEAPIKLLLPTVFFLIFYWMSNLNPYFGAFISTLLLQLLVAFAGESIGLLIGVTIYDVKVAMTGAARGLRVLMCSNSRHETHCA